MGKLTRKPISAERRLKHWAESTAYHFEKMGWGEPPVWVGEVLCG